jgi:hypothetical protein
VRSDLLGQGRPAAPVGGTGARRTERR